MCDVMADFISFMLSESNILLNVQCVLCYGCDRTSWRAEGDGKDDDDNDDDALSVGVGDGNPLEKDAADSA